MWWCGRYIEHNIMTLNIMEKNAFMTFQSLIPWLSIHHEIKTNILSRVNRWFSPLLGLNLLPRKFLGWHFKHLNMLVILSQNLEYFFSYIDCELLSICQRFRMSQWLLSWAICGFVQGDCSITAHLRFIFFTLIFFSAFKKCP